VRHGVQGFLFWKNDGKRWGFITHRIHGAGIYANMTGVYWWDPCYHIYHTWILWVIYNGWYAVYYSLWAFCKFIQSLRLYDNDWHTLTLWPDKRVVFIEFVEG
jgi:hypothetical protein